LIRPESLEAVLATYESRTVLSERHEFIVPATDPWGACWAEVMKAIRAAHSELWELGLVPEGKDASDDAIRIIPEDDGVVVFYLLERSGDSVRLR
jgi:hypothetical protein